VWQTGLECQSQRHALAKNVLLSDYLAQVFRTQSFGQRLMGFGDGVVIHFAGSQVVHLSLILPPIDQSECSNSPGN
jgi:hypothetical protein